jgi:hypothetical protein
VLYPKSGGNQEKKYPRIAIYRTEGRSVIIGPSGMSNVSMLLAAIFEGIRHTQNFGAPKRNPFMHEMRKKGLFDIQRIRHSRKIIITQENNGNYRFLIEKGSFADKAGRLIEETNISLADDTFLAFIEDMTRNFSNEIQGEIIKNLAAKIIPVYIENPAHLDLIDKVPINPDDRKHRGLTNYISQIAGSYIDNEIQRILTSNP